MEYPGIMLLSLTGDNFEVKPGLAKAILPEETEKDYYKWASNSHRSREFALALEERILEPIKNGMLIVKRPDGSVKFDDRKLRFDSYTQEEDGQYTIYAGPTHFGEMKSVDVKAMKDPAFSESIAQRGLADFNDRSAYFSSCFAVNAVPLTENGSLHLFKRSEKSEIYPGHWHVIGGMLDTDLTFFNTGNPTASLKDLVLNRIKAEFKEETSAEQVRFQLTGLVRSLPSTADFTYIARIPMNSKEFVDLSKSAEDSADHQDIMVLSSREEVTSFLKGSERITPTGYGSLVQYLKAS